MGDAVTTPWDLALFCALPMLIVGLPVSVIAALDWRARRRVRRPSDAPASRDVGVRPEPLTRRMAAWAAGLRLSAVPESVREYIDDHQLYRAG